MRAPQFGRKPTPSPTFAARVFAPGRKRRESPQIAAKPTSSLSFGEIQVSPPVPAPGTAFASIFAAETRNPRPQPLRAGCSNGTRKSAARPRTGAG
jgi:hypothetical protein